MNDLELRVVNHDRIVFYEYNDNDIEDFSDREETNDKLFKNISLRLDRWLKLNLNFYNRIIKSNEVTLSWLAYKFADVKGFYFKIKNDDQNTFDGFANKTFCPWGLKDDNWVSNIKMKFDRRAANTIRKLLVQVNPESDDARPGELSFN